LGNPARYVERVWGYALIALPYTDANGVDNWFSIKTVGRISFIQALLQDIQRTLKLLISEFLSCLQLDCPLLRRFIAIATKGKPSHFLILGFIAL
jgi:hypothetical protein